MSNSSHSKSPTEAPVSAEQDAAVKAVGTWVRQFALTLKNSRLYDARNAAVLRFRQQLAAALHQLVQEHGSFTLRFSPDDVTYRDVSLYPAKSRDDNLALPFYRDGVRAMTFHAGVEPVELEYVIASLIRVTAQNGGEDDDLVTMLWQGQLRHIEVDYIPAEGEVGAATATDGEVVPWPTGEAPPATPHPEEAPGLREVSLTDEDPRSDDWKVGVPTAELEVEYEAMRSTAASEAARFLHEFEVERLVSPVTSMVAIAQAFLAAETHADDHVDLARYLPRMLRLAVQEGAWAEAQQTVVMLDRMGGWSPVTYVQQLQQPSTLAALKERLAQQGESHWSAFADFARGLGEASVDVLGGVLAEFDGSVQGRPLAAALVAMCRKSPERLGPWLADRRPAVVRQMVQMLGEIGGVAIVPLLHGALRHHDPRVRAEAVGALQRADLKAARPLLLTVLDANDPKLFLPALQKLSEARDIEVSQRLLLMIIAPEFDARPADEKRAIYAALGSTGGDEVVPELEAELLKGGWFERVDESHQQAVARCLMRIGTPMARMVIEHGAQSRRAQVRDVCRELLARWEGPRA